MTPFFTSPKNHAALILELESWRGTPFVKFGSAGAKKGLRSNCVTFIEGVLVNVGAIKPVQWPQYVITGGGAAMLDLIAKSVRASGLVRVWSRDEAPLQEPNIGDVIIVSTGKRLHHFAIFAGDNTVWHSTEHGRGVCTGNVKDPLITRYAHSIWRAYDQSSI